MYTYTLPVRRKTSAVLCVLLLLAKSAETLFEEGESVDSFITALYALAEHCAYGALHNEMIHDHIVVGICSSSLSEKLQLNPELTLAHRGRSLTSTCVYFL